MSDQPTPTTDARPVPPTPPWLQEALQDWEKAKAAVSIDALAGEIPHNLNMELFDFPETIAKWGFRVSEAVRELQMASMLAEDCLAAAEEKARMLLGPLKRGEVTTSDYQRAARRDPEWRQSELKRIHAEAKVGRLKSTMAGLSAKREALMSLGANLRAELERDPALRSRDPAPRPR